ncbi:MAG: DUF4105 domain-containing protein [Elusimicrobiales bacterium]|nr:DUF4105 domain-containing protein [Elusimicrobiales bacterium]
MQKKRSDQLRSAAALLFLSLLLFPRQAAAITPEKNLQRLALRQAAVKTQAWKSDYWLKLLYYKKKLLGRERSLSENPEFFLAKWGSISPRLELEAALDGLFFDGDPGVSPECRFPERYRWLREKFSIPSSSFPPPECKDFEAWKAGLDTESVSLVFAAGTLDTPSAFYGNTFLRLRKRGAADGLADQAAGYSAAADAERGFFFALKSAAGAYPARFSVLPYEEKLGQYSDIKNRDLWEFPLELDQDGIDRLLRHAWELRGAPFSYYFFTRNCAWQLMPLLDIVKPELKLSRRFSSWVLPQDTVKAALAGSAAPAWRPSLWRTVDWKRGQLTEEEKASVLRLSRGYQPAELNRLEAGDPIRKTAVLETASDYLNWNFYSGRIGKPEFESRGAPLLAALAPLNGRSVFAGGPPRPPSVLEGHKSLRLGAGLVSLRNGPAYELQARFALQDLLDAPEGYLPDAALESGSFRLRYEKHYNRLYMKEARLAHIMSLSPWDEWTRRQSWELSAGLEQAGETGRQSGRSAIWDMSAGSGLAVEWRGPVRQLWYAMVQADSGFGPALNANWRAGAGLKAGLLAERGPVRALFEARYISYAIGDTRPLWAGSLAASLRLDANSSARLEYSWRGEEKEAGLYFYQFLSAP